MSSVSHTLSMPGLVSTNEPEPPSLTIICFSVATSYLRGARLRLQRRALRAGHMRISARNKVPRAAPGAVASVHATIQLCRPVDPTAFQRHNRAGVILQQRRHRLQPHRPITSCAGDQGLAAERGPVHGRTEHSTTSPALPARGVPSRIMPRYPLEWGRAFSFTGAAQLSRGLCEDITVSGGAIATSAAPVRTLAAGVVL